MTQRRRLDAHLAEQAAAAGADFRDGARVERDRARRRRRSPRASAASASAPSFVVGADGANGVVARAIGLGDGIVRGVALEGNVAVGRARARRRTRRPRGSSSASCPAATAGSFRRATTPTWASAAGWTRGRGCARTSTGSLARTASTPAALTRGPRSPAADARPGAPPPWPCRCSSATRPASSIRSPATGSTRRSSRPSSRPSAILAADPRRTSRARRPRSIAHAAASWTAKRAADRYPARLLLGAARPGRVRRRRRAAPRRSRASRARRAASPGRRSRLVLGSRGAPGAVSVSSGPRP